MSCLSDLPRTIRAEVKFSRAESISVPSRELQALLSSENESAGVIAALFWCGNEAIDGEWLIVDAADSVFSRCTSIKVDQLRRACRHQASLDALRCEVERHWKPFFAAHFETAKQGCKPLRRDLLERSQNGTLDEGLPKDIVLHCEHRAAFEALLTTLGPSRTGQAVQHLFAYVLRLIGYRSVTVNTIGVPDIEVSDLVSDSGDVSLRVTPDDLTKLVDYCRDAGDAELAGRLTRYRRDVI